jgi:hypothetical protein
MNNSEQDALHDMVDRFFAQRGCNINEAYSALEYLRDQEAITNAACDSEPIIHTWRNPASGHTHVLRCSQDDYRLRTCNVLLDRHGEPSGINRALRTLALISFFNRNRERLDAERLNWLDIGTSAHRRFRFLTFILNYHVPADRQRGEDAIPASAIDEFLAMPDEEVENQRFVN